ncbi:MAG: hypothetical protein ACSHWQ_01260 [Spongiibacteraceae bacterium]
MQTTLEGRQGIDNLYRIAGDTTAVITKNLIRLLESKDVVRVYIGMADSESNYKALRMVIVHGGIETVLDHGELNLVRPARFAEIADIFTALKARGLLGVCLYSIAEWPDTSDIKGYDAARLPMQLTFSDMHHSEFLSALAGHDFWRNDFSFQGLLA